MQNLKQDKPPGGTFYNRKFYIVTFSAVDGGIGDCIALMDETPAQITGGHGGWQITQRERRLGVTQWRGNDPIRMAVPIIFDKSIHHIQDQGTAMHHLRLMGRPPAVNHGEPPEIFCKGPGVPTATGKGSKQPWVIENIAWGTNRILDINDQWFRQDAVVNLIEYIDEDRVDFPNAPTISKKRKKKHHHNTKPGHHSKPHGWPKFHTYQPGDTLPKMAAHYYKDSSKWRRISRANGNCDPNLKGPHPYIFLIPAP